MVSTTVDLNAKIPNNVGLSDDVKLQRALENMREALAYLQGGEEANDA